MEFALRNCCACFVLNENLDLGLLSSEFLVNRGPKRVSLLEMFKEVTGVEFVTGEVICNPCQEDLKQAYKFQTRALESQRLFQIALMEAVESPALESVELTQNLDDEDPEAPEPDQASKTTSTFKEYQCPHCPASFFKKPVFEEHVIWLHSGEKSFSCERCQEQFDEYPKLKAHNKARHPRASFSCDLCEKVYERLSTLRTHINRIHLRKVSKSKTTFECDICQKKFKQIGTLRLHKAREHQQGKILKPFKCGSCESFWRTSGERNAHERLKHAPRSLKCEICEKTFTNKYAIRNHLLRVHEKTTSVSCHLCENQYASKAGLSVHIKASHARVGFVCSVCGASFSRASSLSTHKKKHEEPQ